MNISQASWSHRERQYNWKPWEAQALYSHFHDLRWPLGCQRLRVCHVLRCWLKTSTLFAPSLMTYTTNIPIVAKKEDFSNSKSPRLASWAFHDLAVHWGEHDRSIAEGSEASGESPKSTGFHHHLDWTWPFVIWGIFCRIFGQTHIIPYPFICEIMSNPIVECKTPYVHLGLNKAASLFKVFASQKDLGISRRGLMLRTSPWCSTTPVWSPAERHVWH